MPVTVVLVRVTDLPTALAPSSIFNVSEPDSPSTVNGVVKALAAVPVKPTLMVSSPSPALTVTPVTEPIASH